MRSHLGRDDERLAAPVLGTRRDGIGRIMQRRQFLSSLAGSVPFAVACGRPAEAPTNGLKLSVTCDMFRGNERGLPVDTVDRKDPRPDPHVKYTPDEGLALAKSHGYEGFEMFDWRNAEARTAYGAAMRKHGLEAVCITANKGVRAPGCSLTDPSERDGFLQEISDASAVAAEFDCRRLVVLTGFEREGVPRAEQMDSCVASLREAVPILEKAGMTIVIEPINTLVTRPGFFLPGAREGFEMLRRVGSPNVKLLFDIYHVQVTDGDLILQIQNNIDLIGHFQIGDHPGRMQPGTGEINYRNVFRAIYELQEARKFDGYAGLEYHPNVTLPQTMAEVRELANFSGGSSV